MTASPSSSPRQPRQRPDRRADRQAVHRRDHQLEGRGGNDAEIVLIGREAGSGTRDGFESITGTKDACQYRQELTSTGDVITAVAGQNPDAIGYASLSAVEDTVKALTVGGVAPARRPSRTAAIRSSVPSCW